MENLLSWASGQMEGEIPHFESIDPSSVINEMIELYSEVANRERNFAAC